MLFDFETLSAQNRYKLLTSTVVPRPIAWVVTLNPKGLPNAAPFSFFNTFGSNPPVVVIGIGRKDDGDDKDSGANIRRTGQFVVNLVSEALVDAMNVTAIDFGPTISELEEAGLATLPSVKVKPPRIADSPVALECEAMNFMDISEDRSLAVGKVLAMHVPDEMVLDPVRCHIDTPRLKLIGRMHGAGGYVRTSDQFDLPRIKLEDWTAKR